MGVDALFACAGRWSGRNTLQDPEYGMAEECPSDAVLTPVAGDRFEPRRQGWKPIAGILAVLSGWRGWRGAKIAHPRPSWERSCTS
jgi:hypothetical protein